MKENNSLGRAGFIVEHIVWALIAWVWYKNILFRCIGYKSLQESLIILAILVALSCVFGILLEIEHSRNNVSVAVDLVLGFGVYTVLTYLEIRRGLILACVSAVFILSAVSVILIMGRRINHPDRSGRILVRRARRAAYMTRRIAGAGLGVIILVSAGNIFFGSSIIKADTKPASQANVSDQSLANNMETMSMLQIGLWETLTVQEKLNVMQTAANIEQRYLGLPHELNVGAANLEEDVMGTYSDQTHEILIDMDSLLYDSPWIVLNTLCHEAYHSYQHRLVDVYNNVDDSAKSLRVFGKARSYASEFANYKGESDTTEDFLEYYFQDCESDAREYASESVYEYYTRITEYLAEQAENQDAA